MAASLNKIWNGNLEATTQGRILKLKRGRRRESKFIKELHTPDIQIFGRRIKCDV